MLGKITKISKTGMTLPSNRDKDDAYQASTVDHSDKPNHSSEDKTSSTCSDDFKRDKSSFNGSCGAANERTSSNESEIS